MCISSLAGTARVPLTSNLSTSCSAVKLGLLVEQNMLFCPPLQPPSITQRAPDTHKASTLT